VFGLGTSFVASAATPAFVRWLSDARVALVFAILSVLLWIMHRANIDRLLEGTEGRIGAARSDEKIV
jgi:glycerol-3-phosphate acyltransferase PlsY